MTNGLIAIGALGLFLWTAAYLVMALIVIMSEDSDWWNGK